MRICSNCGATNREEEGNICRKCGALLPVSRNNRRRRIEMPTSEENEIRVSLSQMNNSNYTNHIENNNYNALLNNPEAQFFHSQEALSEQKRTELDLQEIPLTEVNLIEQPKVEISESQTSQLSMIPPEIITTERPTVNPLPNKNDISLPEIKPQPYQGSILAPLNSIGKPSIIPLNTNDSSSVPTVKPLPSAISQEKLETPQKNKEILDTQSEAPSKKNDDTFSIQKQKQIDLEQDMVEVLKILSNKLSLPDNKTISLDKIKKGKKIDEKIQPSSLNEILKTLLTMNRHIEAAALLKKDGTILAAAISTRISDSLFATIGQNLAMIGTDIIHGLSAGDLQSISIRGSEGILDLAPLSKDSPIVRDMLLMIFSNPKIRSGVIFFAVKSVEKLIIEFLNGN